MTRPDLDGLQAQDVTGADYTSAASIAKVVAKLTDWQWLAEYANAGWNLPAAGTDALALLCGRAAAIIERLALERDAAALAMRERAAQACEELSAEWFPRDKHEAAREGAIMRCAAAVRALEP